MTTTCGQVVRLSCLIVMLIGCNRGEESVQSTTKEVDILPAGEPAAPTQSDGPTKIGTLPLMAAIQPGGTCEIKTQGAYSVVVKDVRYEENFPPRLISVALGDSSRAYPPINLEANIRRESGLDQNETESIHVIFNANGNVQAGNRQYYASATGGGERRELTAQDIEQAKQLVAQLLETCK